MTDSNDSSVYKGLLEALAAHKAQMKAEGLEFEDLFNRSYFINPRTRDSLYSELKKPPVSMGKFKDSDYRYTQNGFETYESDFIPEGMMVSVPKKSTYASFTRPDIKFDRLEFKSEEISPYMHSFGAEIERRIWEKIIGAVGIPNDYFKSRDQDWHRMDNESFSAWGIRLEKLGLIDDQTYRQAYQKAVLTAFVTSPIRLVKNILKLRITRKADK